MWKNGLLHFLTLLTFKGEVSDGQEALRNGANDVIVVERADGRFASTKWIAQFGKLHSLFESREGNTVHIFVNNIPARPRMIIQDSGSVEFKGSSDNFMSSRELAELNLKYGLNRGFYVAKELDTAFPFNVFLYKDTDKLILTDVDGTITESDIKGHIYPHFGLPADHDHVIQLFHKLGEMDYKIVYLTARSYSQDDDTKEYLFEMLQNRSGFSLPVGPVLSSPNPFVNSLVSEVINGNPFIEKTKTILGIKRVFETTEKQSIMETIVAAFGNKETDTKAYVDAGIDPMKIFIVDPEGVVVNAGTNETTSYLHLVQNLNEIVPVD